MNVLSSFFVTDGRLYLEEPETARAGRRPEQIVALYTGPIQKIVESLETGIVEMRRRPAGRFERRRGTLGSKEVFAGTRILVDSVRRMLAAGLGDEEIRAAYPDLEPADIAAVRQENSTRPRDHAAAG